MTDGTWLTPDVIHAVTTHMNGDHADDNVVMCRGAGGHPGVTAARMTCLDLNAIEFTATDPDGEALVRIRFSTPLADRAQIRAEVARMYHESAAILGLPARDH